MKYSGRMSLDKKKAMTTFLRRGRGGPCLDTHGKASKTKQKTGKGKKRQRKARKDLTRQQNNVIMNPSMDKVIVR